MISIRALSKSFSDNHVLRGISCDVEAGEIVGFVGANGSGKTTLMRCIMGLLKAERGEIVIDGVARDSGTRLSRALGYMPEERGLYINQSLHSQLHFFGELQGIPRSLRAQRIYEILAQFGLEEHLHSKLGDLSLGNQQRVQLAVALLHRPRYLILDEPFSGIDPSGVDALTRVLQEEAQKGVGIIFSSHILPYVEEISHKILILSKGSIHVFGQVPENLSHFYQSLELSNG